MTHASHLGPVDSSELERADAPSEARLSLPDDAGLAPGWGTVDLVLHAEPGTELSLGSPVCASVEVTRGADHLVVPEPQISLAAIASTNQPVAIPVQIAELPAAVAFAELTATIEYVICEADEPSACAPGRVRLALPVRLLREGGRDRLSFRVPLGR